MEMSTPFANVMSNEKIELNSMIVYFVYHTATMTSNMLHFLFLKMRKILYKRVKITKSHCCLSYAAVTHSHVLLAERELLDHKTSTFIT